MEWKEFTEKNRRAWNEANEKHVKARLEQDCFEIRNEDQFLEPVILNYIEDNNLIKDKTIAQLCCNSGRETISLKRLGAAKIVGFDISDEAIKEARLLNRQAGEDCDFIQTDVYDIGKEFNNGFDLIFISAGSLIWLPDLKQFFAITSRLLKNGGGVLIHEIHPLVWTLEDAPSTNPLQISNSYFKEGPVLEHGGLDYIGDEDYEGEENYTFDHTFSDILNALIKNGFKILEVNEYPQDISGCFHHLEGQEIMLPLSYMLFAST